MKAKVRQQRRGVWWALLGAGVLFTACATTPPLVPAEGETTVAGVPAAAVGEADGVRVIADADAWRAFPRDLGVAIPMRVRIENQSGVPLRITYDAFTLDLQGGMVLAAVPPLDVRGQTWVRDWNAPGPYMGGSFGWYGHPMVHRGFYLAPGYRRYYPAMPRWYGRWGYGGAWTWAPPAWPVELPTRDMLVHAVPEGVLEEGGVVDGFIYFPVLPREAQSVRFSFEVVDADTGEPQGAVSLAFDAR